MISSGSMSNVEFDVIIAGGLGLVGSSLACALATNPRTRHLRIAVVDNAPMPTASSDSSTSADLPAPDIRVSAITPASLSVFKQCGAWSLMNPGRFKPFTSMQVWDSQGSGCMRFAAADGHQDSVKSESDSLGILVENQQLLGALNRRLLELSTSSSGRIALFGSAKLSSIQAHDGDNSSSWPVINIESKDQGNIKLCGRLVVHPNKFVCFFCV
jgi:2-polyprenyl-6-methoxyphenol hydroxylase-like FAD-dependent oxidoreductase